MAQVLGKYLLHEEGQSSGRDWFPVSDASGTELKGCVNLEQALASAPLLCLLLPRGGGGQTHTQLWRSESGPESGQELDF